MTVPERSRAAPLAGDVLDPGGNRAFVLAEWSDDGSEPGRPIAPLHVHRDEDEAWYVLEGVLLIRVGDEVVEAPAGSAVFGPKGVPHTFSNPAPSPARYLLVMQPRTWALLQALHPEERQGMDLVELFRAHGVEIVEETG